MAIGGQSETADGAPGTSGCWVGRCGHAQSPVPKAGHASEQETALSPQGLRRLCPGIGSAV